MVVLKLFKFLGYSARTSQAIELSKMGKKSSTQKTIDYVTRYWFELYGTDEPPSERKALEYIEKARTKGHSNKTIHKTLITLRSIFRTTGNAGAFEKAISLVRVNHFRAERRRTEMIPFSEVMQLVNSPNGETADGKRDRALLALLIGGGLRVGEVLLLRVGDVCLSREGTLYVELRDTKNGESTQQAISEQFAPLIKEFVDLRWSEGAEPGAVLITGYKNGRATGKVLGRRWVSRKFEDYAKSCGLEGVSTHSCRRTAITKLLSDGLTYREVQEFSRHRSVRMVEVYDKRRFEIDGSPAKKLRF